jgi:DNA-binding NtrC family response regulator
MSLRNAGLATAPAAHRLIGRSAAMEKVRRLIAKAARTRLPVLILGQSGTGKELVARAIYELAPQGSFVPIDCGALVGTLVESELFGHVRGSFSGAIENKKGLVEVADGGTAFLDEVGDLPLEMQVKFLRLLQEKDFRPVGGLSRHRVDLRIVAATHRDLRSMVRAGTFREDLYFRLNVFSIRVPSLCERRDDIPLLVEYFLAHAGWSGSVAPETLQALLAHDWPGNVRELQNTVERMVATNSGGTLLPADLPTTLQYNANSLAHLAEAIDIRAEDPAPPFALTPPSPVISIQEGEKYIIQRALAAERGDRARTAKVLGIGRTTLYRKMKAYGIQ